MVAPMDGNNGKGNGNGNGHKPREKMKLGVGQVVSYPDDGIPDSTVIEIDHVTLQDERGKLKQQWDTFILRSEEPKGSKHHLWRIANMPNLGVHFCFSADDNPKKPEDLAPFKREDLSGRIQVQREGLHPMRHYQGTLEVYVLPGGEIYAIKNTDQPAGTQHFDCVPRFDTLD